MVTTRSMAAKAKQMKKSSAPTLGMNLILCHDNFVHIAGLVAATSSEPIADLQSLRATCKAMYAASKERHVGRHVPLKRLKKMRWLESERYHAVVRHLANADNPDACFAIGIKLVFADGDSEQGIRYLDRAVAAGHKAAKYIVGLLLYTSDKTRADGKNYISQVEGDDVTASPNATIANQECLQCRDIAVDAVEEMMWKKVAAGRTTEKALALPEDDHQCSSSICGKKGWGGYEDFCSHGCRIKHEYLNFFGRVMNYLP